ncbi:MAG: hypothetical protein M3Q07_05125, partial [Pseudobdellovibrionaceae bacterium]|nr:hypothetical protein [Pseudobdellovibrionaceae bacterium]
MQEIIRLAQRVKEVAQNNPEKIFERSLDKIYTSVLTPIKKITLGRQRFRASGKEYFYATHFYNATWRNERAVEVPLLNEFLEINRLRRILELGNVSAYYSKNNRPPLVVDKYERSKTVQNLDVLDIPHTFNIEGIVSISTLEHIGWDEAIKDPLKPLKCLMHLYELVSDKSNVLFT